MDTTRPKTQRKFTPDDELPKILQVGDDIARTGWNACLPCPFKKGEKVIVDANQVGVPAGYVRIKHGTPKRISVLHVGHFVKPVLKA